jgi:hypothetical protein
MTNEQLAFLSDVSPRYVWWKTKEESLENPNFIITQIMNIGDYKDIEILTSIFSKDTLVFALKNASPSNLTDKSWTYWHYRLGLTPIEQPVPNQKMREIPIDAF